MLKVLLVDDHQMFRDGIRSVLNQQADIRVCGEAGDGREALAAAQALAPDIVVMDIGLPGFNGIEATRQLLERHGLSKVIALSMNGDRRYVHAMFKAGAAGYVLKTAAADELVRAVRAVAGGAKFVSSGIASVVLEPRVAQPDGTFEDEAAVLSAREREVLSLIAQGLTSKEVATQLDLRVSTVETHRKHLMAKLKLRSIADLTRFAIKNGLSQLE